MVIFIIYSPKIFTKNGINERGRYNQIANYVYTQSEINIKIKDQAPKEYMNKVKEQCEGKNNGYGGIDSMKELQKILMIIAYRKKFSIWIILIMMNF